MNKSIAESIRVASELKAEGYSIEQIANVLRVSQSRARTLLSVKDRKYTPEQEEILKDTELTTSEAAEKSGLCTKYVSDYRSLHKIQRQWSKYDPYMPEAIRLRQSGMTIREIATRLELDEGLLGYCFRKQKNSTPKEETLSVPAPVPVPTQETNINLDRSELQFVKFYEFIKQSSKTMSMKEIYEKIPGIKYETLLRLNKLSENNYQRIVNSIIDDRSIGLSDASAFTGIPLARISQIRIERKGARKWNDRYAEILLLRKQGASVEEIITELKIPKSTLYKILRDNR